MTNAEDALRKMRAWLNDTDQGLQSLYHMWWDSRPGLFTKLIEYGYGDAKNERSGIAFADGSRWIANHNTATMELG